MSSEQQNAENAANTLKLFFEQFGTDIYAEILIGEILEGLFHAETVFIFGEQVEEGD